MKKIVLPLFVLAAVVAVFFVPASQTQVMGLVTLPDPLVLAIQTAFVFAAGWAFSQIGAAFPWFTNLFGKFADEVAFVLSGALIGFINNYLAMIPPMWETPANIFLGFLVSILAALQIFRFFGKAEVPTFRAQ
jgi:hypothetical protein